MKKFGAYLSLIGLFSQATALAWVGGPYSNNTYDGLDGGIFGGTIRGSATSGIFKFSQGSEAYVSPYGDSIVYHRGMAYYGECYGYVDFDSKTVSGVTNGNISGSTTDPNNRAAYTNLYSNSGGGSFGVQNGAPTAGSAVAAANSAWNGKITKSKQTVRFRAKGEMSFFGNATEVTTIIDVNSTGDFQDPRRDVPNPAVVGDVSTGLNLTGVGNPPGSGSTSRVDGVSNNFPNISEKIKIKVYGSRTRVNPFVGSGAYVG